MNKRPMVALIMEQTEKSSVTLCYRLSERGTHIRNTAEIGRVVIGKIENKGRQNRRINIAFAE